MIQLSHGIRFPLGFYPSDLGLVSVMAIWANPESRTLEKIKGH